MTPPPVTNPTISFTSGITMAIVDNAPTEGANAQINERLRRPIGSGSSG
jgi:hypothetical protein